MATINFERTTMRNGFLKPAQLTYSLTDQSGKTIGVLVINGRKASYEGRSATESLVLQKSFWGTSWNYAGDGDRLFAKLSRGWRAGLTMADESKYQLQLIRKRWLFSKKDIPGYLQAVFRVDDEVVFTLDNLYKRKWMEAETTAPMQGTITTDLTDAQKIVAFLLAIQSRIEAEAQAAAAA